MKHIIYLFIQVIVYLFANFGISTYGQTTNYFREIGGLPVFPSVENTTVVSSPARGAIVYSTADATIKIYDGSSWNDLTAGLAFTSNEQFLQVKDGIPLIPSLTADPASTGLIAGAFYLNRNTKQMRYYDGTNWQDLIGNYPPAVDDLAVNGTATQNSTLSSVYSYCDVEGDIEGTSTYQWYRSASADGSMPTAISGATSSTYTLSTDDVGFYIGFSVTPVAVSGTSPGAVAVSTIFAGPVIKAPFISTWDMEAGNFTLPVYSEELYNCSINWGDGSSSDVSSSSDPNLIHSYAAAGIYNISISGTFSGLNINNGIYSFFLMSIVQWGDVNWKRFTNAFWGCEQLNYIPDEPLPATNETDFSNCFNNTRLGSIPTDLFKNNTAVTTFNSCFDYCDNISSIPTGLFDYNTAATSFEYCFSGLSINSIPAGLFNNNTAVTTFNSCFLNCYFLESIPAGLFDNNAAVTNFYSCFENCDIRTIPVGLFDNNMAVTNFSYCFYMNSFLIGSAPELWLRSPTPTGNYCFGNCIDLTNYASIPANWK